MILSKIILFDTFHFGTELWQCQKNCEGWLVRVWDGMKWDGSHRFWTSSHQCPTRSHSTKMPHHSAKSDWEQVKGHGDIETAASKTHKLSSHFISRCFRSTLPVKKSSHKQVPSPSEKSFWKFNCFRQKYLKSLLLRHWYEIMALYYVKSILTEISASRQDTRVL